MHIAGLVFDDSKHYLDHLGPFCALAGWPLIVCEPGIYDEAKRFYPDLNVQYVPLGELKLPKFTISCAPKTLLEVYFPNQSTTLFWLPHGQSDKGWNSPIFQALSNEIALVYGRRMIDFMHEQKVFLKTISIGNFRWEYCCKTTETVNKTFLYAPTWDNDSFWKIFPLLAKQLPPDCNLWVKLHPNTWRKFAPEIEVLIGKYSQSNIQFLPNEAPIYPLLAKCACYIGDMSSIGYDFLTFNRPMYFVNANPHLPLHRCGKAIDPTNFDLQLQNDFSEEQKTLYQYTFDVNSHWKEEIDALCRL